MTPENITKCFRDLTPVEDIEGIFFKREDKFMPFGEGGVNGSKLRQLIWLFQRAQKQGKKGVIAGAVSESPQNIMVAVVAEAFGMKCIIVTGAKEPSKHKLLAAAQKHGAEFFHSKVGYAQALQGAAFKLLAEHPDYFVVETNITTSEKRNSIDDIRAFHEVGAHQCKDIPDEVDCVIVPAGSCNSAVSILLGIYLHQKKNIQDIYLMGIGSLGSKDINYIKRRLAKISQGAAAMYSEINTPAEGKITLLHYDLNGDGFCKYSDLMPYRIGDLDAHPRYEGKIFQYIDKKGMWPFFRGRKCLMWNVGVAPSL